MAAVELSDRDRVEEAIRDVRFERYPDWSKPTLLCHPADARRLCYEVRSRLQLPRHVWTDFMILQLLLPAKQRARRRP